MQGNASQHFISSLRRALPKADALEGEDTGSVDKEVCVIVGVLCLCVCVSVRVCV